MKKIKIVVGITNNPKPIIERTMDSFKREGIPCNILIHKVNTFETSGCEITYIDTRHGTQSLYNIKEHYNPDVCCGTINIPNILYVPNGSPFYNFVKLETKLFNDHYKNLTIEEYCKNDVKTTEKAISGIHLTSDNYYKELGFGIEKVIFNDPATIVLWNDNTKTVVKTQEDDEFDEEIGLAMAISKKALGNKGNYYEVFKKWMPQFEKKGFDYGTIISEYFESMERVSEMIQNTFKSGPITYGLDLGVEECCPTCGRAITYTSNYCPKCGRKLDCSKWKERQ